MSLLSPDDRLDIKRIRPGLRLLAIDHVFSQSMAVLASGAFMVGLVLALGGDNKTIGLIAAIGPIAHVIQVPAIFLVQSVRRRRAITVLGAWTGRSVFFFIALIPWILPPSAHIPALLLAVATHCVCGSISGYAYGSWVRDVIPDRVMGRYTGRRLGGPSASAQSSAWSRGPCSAWRGPAKHSAPRSPTRSCSPPPASSASSGPPNSPASPNHR
ncbi:MAG: hypothetical protein AAF750_09045 [Planctomycetota bacterium]